MIETLFNLSALQGDARLRLDDDGAHVIAAPRAGGAVRSWRILPVLFEPRELVRTVHLGAVELIYTSTRARLVVAGEDRWTFDTARFAGSPVLKVGQFDDEVRITLTGARFPGTTIPADLKARMYHHSVHGWALDLRLAWGGFMVTVPLLGFLDGSVKAAAPVAVDGVVCGLGSNSMVVSGGVGLATYHPAWSISVVGPAIVRLQGFGADVVRHALTVVLLAPEMTSWLLAPSTRRSAVFLGLGDPFTLEFWPDPVLEFAAAAPFRWLAVEAGEDAAGPRRVLCAVGDAGDGLEFGPAPELRRADGTRFTVALQAPVFVALYGPKEARLARGVIATLAGQRRDLHAARISLLVARPREHRPFVLGELDGKRALVCVLDWVAHAARPGGDVVSDPLPPDDDTSLHIVLDDAPAPAPTAGELRIVGGDPHARITTPVGVSLRALRPRDLLVLTHTLVGLRLVARGEAARLVRAGPDARLVVQLPPQSIAEEAVTETEHDDPLVSLPLPPIRAYVAEPSRLAFVLRAGTDALPYDLDTLLAWHDPRLAPSLAPAASGGLHIEIRAPRADETAIEAPFRLVLSPDVNGAWEHRTAPAERGGRTELWHTRLVHGSTLGPHPVRTRGPLVVRPIWTPGYPTPLMNPGGMTMSMKPEDRCDLVAQSVADAPPHADLLLLTALGAWLDLDGRWSNEALPLSAWIHRATMGRDHFVRVVRRGFLYPYGHRAVLISITERKVQQKPSGRLGAYLRRRDFVVFREPEATYLPGDAPRYLHGGREMPLVRIRILDRSTPNLDPRPQSGEPDPDHVLIRPLAASPEWTVDSAMWLRVDGHDLLVRMRGWDREDRPVDFTAPVAFLAQPDAQTVAPMVAAAAHSLAGAPKDRRIRPFGGQRLAFAAIARPGDTTFEVESLTFAAHSVAWAPGDAHRPFYPHIDEAAVVLPALRHFGGDDAATAVVYHPPYLDRGFDGRGDLFLATRSAPTLRFGGEHSAAAVGGLITPNLAVGGVSRSLGLCGEGLDAIDSGKFDPNAYFGDLLSAGLLGGVSLRDVLVPDVAFDAAAESAEIPKWRELIDGPRRRYALTWSTTQLQSSRGFVPDGGVSLVVEAVAELSTAGAVTASTSATLRGFTMRLAGVIEIGFDHITFLTRPGEKPDVDVAITGVKFLGDLDFVQKLTSYLQLAGFVDPPAVDVSSAGVQVGYTLAIPAITVGVFSLQNLRLAAAVALPFDGSPLRARFALSTREDPFTITVMIFGGGGFFAVAVGLDGVEAIELTLEFGGNWALDFGVASGGVHAMAGIYIRLDAGTDATELTGYVRVGGELSVLGIASVGLELCLGLTYADSDGSRCAWGEASMKLEVEVGFFSVGFTATVRREFSGSSTARPLGETMNYGEWTTYCDAFAT